MKLLRNFLLISQALLLLTSDVPAQNYPVVITTNVIPPVSAYFNQAINNAGRSVSIILRNTWNEPVSIVLFGKLERIAPSPFTIQLREDFTNYVVNLLPNQVYQLTGRDIEQAFGSFHENDLVHSGISPDQLKDGLNYKIPEGFYQICVYARRIAENELRGFASDPNPPSGCSNFTVCQLAAPQFTQPVNNLNISSSIPVLNPASPVNFTWLPPQSSCGLEGTSGPFTYDLEIREILENQTITDAVNYNPYVFRRTAIPSSIFLLDTNLYRNILQRGRRYAIRVRANIRNNAIAVENNGYSRIEAFQYGEASLPPAMARSPQSFYIPFAQRKSNLWDDALTAYENKQRKDTSVPINEYISLVLARNGIVYSLDAIEMLTALYPELQESRQEKLSSVPDLPAFPDVPGNLKKSFEDEHTTSLLPDSLEQRKFLRYADSLLTLIQQRRGSDTSMQMFDNVAPTLSNFRQAVPTADRASVSNINNILAEILYILRLYPPSFTAQYNQMRQLVADLGSLMAPAFNGLSFLRPKKAKKTSLAAYRVKADENFLPPAMDQALPFDIVVYHYPKDQPSTPVSTSAALMGAYKIFYVAANLYNRKNPEINVNTTKAPASTSQVTLPKIKFKFWTQNMFTQKLTTPQDVDLLDAFLNSGKRWPYPKRFSIVIKVD